MDKFETMPLSFRVWDKEEKCFITKDWDFAIRLDCGVSHHHGVIDYGWQERFVISQDTGLKDKNRKSIYTGDIVHYRPYNRYVPVLYRNGMIVIQIRWGEEYYLSNHLSDIELAGNIWQNPELLEEE